MAKWPIMVYFTHYKDLANRSMPPQEPQQTPVVASRNPLGIPVAIVIAAALIAGAIVYTGTQGSGNTAQVAGSKNQGTQETAETVVLPVTDKDHIRGNPNAPIKIVEYSDFDCPFCKNFHETMNKIMADYGTNGQIAWVYRHFPLEQLHPNAPKVAEASECVASLGNDESFWKFADLVFGERSTNAQTDITKLPEYAERAGVSKEKFNACMTAGTFKEAIAEDVQEAMKAGARGTPYSIVVVGDEKQVINGAQPYANVKSMLDSVIAQIDAQL